MESPTSWTTREKLAMISFSVREGENKWVGAEQFLRPFLEAGRPSGWLSAAACACQFKSLIVDFANGAGNSIETTARREDILTSLTSRRIEELQQQLAKELSDYERLCDELRLIQSGAIDDKLDELLRKHKSDVDNIYHTSSEVKYSHGKLKTSGSVTSSVSATVPADHCLAADTSNNDGTVDKDPTRCKIEGIREQNQLVSVESDVKIGCFEENKPGMRFQNTSGDHFPAFSENGEAASMKIGESPHKSASEDEEGKVCSNASPLSAVDGYVQSSGAESKVVETSRRSVYERNNMNLQCTKFISHSPEESCSGVEDKSSLFRSVSNNDEEDKPREATEEVERCMPILKQKEICVEHVVQRREESSDENTLACADEPSALPTLTEQDIADEKQGLPSENSSDAGSPAYIRKGELVLTLPKDPTSEVDEKKQEECSNYKAWKKSIMILWKQIASHRHASLFLQPVTDDIAPNYSTTIRRAIDLSSIKRDVENGVTRTTSEFQRDLLLMFQNAIMYNNKEHDVYKMATEMRSEVVDQVAHFLATQIMAGTYRSRACAPSSEQRSGEIKATKDMLLSVLVREARTKRIVTIGGETRLTRKKQPQHE